MFRTTKLPESKTEITLQLPNEPTHGRFEPLKFCVKTEGNFRSTQQEGLRLTIDKAKNFVMSVNVFEPGSKRSPVIMQQNGTIWQQETVRRSENKIAINRQTQIEPGADYRLEIISTDGCSAEARLVKIEKITQESKPLDYDSQLFQTVYPSIAGLLRLKVLESKMRTKIPFKTDFDESVAKTSILTAINKLHSHKRLELEKMCKTANLTQNITTGNQALGSFLLALNRTDIGQLLQDQLQVTVSEDDYPLLLGLVYNDVYVRFIDIILTHAKKYVS